MVKVKATKDSEAGVLPTKELLTAMGQFNEKLVKAGIMLAGEGYWLWQVSSIEEAADSDIDIRPIFELEDFGGVITDEAKAQEQDLRERTPTWK